MCDSRFTEPVTGVELVGVSDGVVRGRGRLLLLPNLSM